MSIPNESHPLVSVIIPLYNAEQYISDSINSALAQTCPNIEIIVVDDGSTDNGYEAAKKLESKKVRVLQQVNKGASAARNYGLKHAKGKYIQFLDADDLLNAEKIEDQINRLNGSEDYLALCRTVHFNNDEDYRSGKLITDWFCRDTNDPVDFLLKLNAGYEAIYGYGGMIQPNAWLTPKAVIDKAGLWDEAIALDDDGEFFCRVLLASQGVRYSEKAINYYRKFKQETSLSGKKSLKAYQDLATVIDLKFKYLKQRITDPILEKVFARQYWELGVSSYPKFKQLSKGLIQKADKMGYTGQKYKSGPLSTLLSKFFGWRIMRTLSYMKYGV